MYDLTAKRTLVKSPPELWSEVSEVERLAKHLGAFGEIKITKVEPERTVAWEGEAASGTVSIEPSGWGTKVTLTAQIEAQTPEGGAVPAAPEPEPAADAEGEPAEAAEETEPAAEAEGEPAEAVEPAEPERQPEHTGAATRRPGFFARLFGWAPREELRPVSGGSEPDKEPEPIPQEPEPIPQESPPAPAATVAAPAPEAERAQAALDDVLEALGSAHHRPFSRG